MEQGTKTAIVTGGARGIGQAISRLLALSQYRVAIADLQEEEAQRLARELPGEHLGLRTDVTSFASVHSMVQRVLQEWGTIDLLVNCAGWTRIAPFQETDDAYWRRVIEINYLGVLNTTKAVLGPMMEQKGGCIINITSDAARVGSPGEAVYAGAKAAVVAFSKSLAREVVSHNIRVNCVSPGLIETPLVEELRENEKGKRLVEKMIKRIPMKRPGTPEEVALTVLFLASSAASYITGQVISVNGGMHMVD